MGKCSLLLGDIELNRAMSSEKPIGASTEPTTDKEMMEQ